jgi:hypothetical protein
MPEQGWNHHQAVEECLQKGGFRGSLTDAVKASVKVTRYQSSIQKMTYAEYLEWKKSG